MNMMRFFHGGTVVRNLESSNKYDAIHELLDKAPVLASNDDRINIERAVMERERICTTGIGRGVAIAHGKLRDLGRMIILLGISPEGINFDSLDGLPVHLLFLIVNPPEKSGEYLLALSTIARMMRNKPFLEAVIEELNAVMVEKLIAKEFSASLQLQYQ